MDYLRYLFSLLRGKILGTLEKRRNNVVNNVYITDRKESRHEYEEEANKLSIRAKYFNAGQVPGGLAVKQLGAVTAVAWVRSLAKEFVHAMGTDKKKEKKAAFIDHYVSEKFLVSQAKTKNTGVPTAAQR